MVERYCVLVTGVGGGSAGHEILKAFKLAKQKYKIVTADMLLTSPGLYESDSSYILPSASSKDYVDKILQICAKEKVHGIAPGSDPEIEKIAENAQLFEKHGIKILVNSWPVIKLCKDKFRLLQFLKSNEINCSDFSLYKKKSDIEMFNEFPVVVKPRFGAGSRNVFIARDKNELLFFCKYLKKYGSEPLVQKYVGSYEDEYTIGVLSLDNGNFTTSIVMKRILGSGLSTRQIVEDPTRKNKYIISSGFSQGLIDNFKDLGLKGEKIAKMLKTNGPINIQCRVVGNEIIPFEINPRFSGTTGARSLAGYNEPDLFFKYLFFNKKPTKLTYKHGFVMRTLHENFISKNETKHVFRFK